MSRRRIASALLVAASLLAPVSGVAAKANGAPSGGGGGGTPVVLGDPDWGIPCSPADIRTGPYRCFGQAWGSPSNFGVESKVSTGGTPTGVSMTSDSHISFRGTYSLSKSAAGVAFTFAVTSGRFDTVDSGLSPSVPAGGTALDGRHGKFVTLDLVATHRSCSTCVAELHEVLGGTEPGRGTGSEYGYLQNATYVVTVRNTAGGAVPPGPVDVAVGLRSHAHGIADPMWSGYVDAAAQVWSSGLTAKPVA
jgi:hypothetical protein